MTETLYTTDEVASICHVKKETVREWIKADKLKAVKRGRAYLITETALKSFLGERNG